MSAGFFRRPVAAPRTPPPLRALLALLALCCGLSAGYPVSADAGEADLATAINKAGRQRMLTQRIVKAYAQIHLGVMPEVSRAELAGAVEQFETQLSELEPLATDRATREALEAMRSAWRPFRAAAASPPGSDGLRALVAGDADLLGAAQKLVLRLQDRAGTPLGRLVNISGRQRMLSQRMAKVYMLRLAGLDTAALREEMESAQNEFVGALAELRAAPENTDAIRNELDTVALQWEWFQGALALEGAHSYKLIVADASESILDSMELITAMYQDLLARH